MASALGFALGTAAAAGAGAGAAAVVAARRATIETSCEGMDGGVSIGCY